MPSLAYVTRTEGRERLEKVFDHRHDAVSFASQQVADDAELALVFEVTLPDMPEHKRVRAALVQMRTGNSRLVHAISHRLSDAEYDKWVTQELKRMAEKDPDGFYRRLKQFLDRKNAKTT